MSQPAPRRSSIRWLPALSLLLLVGACSPVLKQGNALARQGRYQDAAAFYMDTLEDDPGSGPARAGLRKVGESAYRQLLDIAREREAEEDYESSLPAYDEVIALVARLKTHDILVFEPDPNLRDEREGVRRQLLEQAYRQGLANAQMGRWEAALVAFEKATEIDPGFLDLPEQLERTHRALAERALDTRRYDDAVREFYAAHEISGDTAHLAWAAAIVAAQGRYYLREGACRQAIERFELALPHVVNDPTLEQELATAVDCAEIELVVERFTLADGLVVPGGVDLGQLVTDKLAEQLDSQGSRHIQLIDPIAAQSQALSTIGGHRYRVRGRISRLEVDRPEKTKETMQGTGTMRDLCLGLDGYYSSKDEYCDQEVPVAYTRHEQKVEMKISAAIKVVDPATGEQKFTGTHDASAEHVAAQLTDFKRVVQGEWVPTRVGAEPSRDVVALPEDMLALREEPEPLPSDTDMVAAAAENLATEVAAKILVKVDVGPEVPPPKALANIRRPVIDPEDIQLRPGDIISQPERPPLIEVEPEPEPAPEAPPEAENRGQLSHEEPAP